MLKARIAQGLEHNTYNVGVDGSNPSASTNYIYILSPIIIHNDCSLRKIMLYYYYMEDKLNKLIYKAKHIMKNSRDPIHDLGHVSRVVSYVKAFVKDTDLSEQQKQAVILAAWWHDAARALTKNTSFVWMAIVDDTLSALMLWKETIKCGLFGAPVGMATRMIICKSFGIGPILAKILFRKKNRILVNILEDADTVDMLYKERLRYMMSFVENSKLYYYGYKVIMWWCVKTAEIYVKTEQAAKFLQEMLTSFIKWLKEKNIYDWHVRQFGLEWVKKMLASVEGMLLFVLSANYKSKLIMV